MAVQINLMNPGKYVKSGTVLTTCGNVWITKHVFSGETFWMAGVIVQIHLMKYKNIILAGNV